jgi:hypothetical protein
MNKNILITIILLILTVICLAGIFYSRKKNTQVFPQIGSIATVTPVPAIILPPEKEQQKVIVADEKIHIALMLTVTSPADKSTVTNPTLIVKGKTSPKAEVFVNESEGVADADGNFSLSITLDEGDNPVIVMVNDADGNLAEKDMNIIYDAGQ